MLRLIFTVCCAAMVIVSIATNLIPVCLPLLRHGFGTGPLSNEQLGRVAAMTFVGLVSGIAIAGPLANRYPAKVFALGGCALAAVGLTLLGMTTSYLQVLIGVGVLGCGGGMLDMILSPIVCATRPKHRTVALNWLHSFYCVGAVLTLLVATISLSAGVAWQKLSLWMIVPTVLVGGCFIFLPIPPIVVEPGQRAKVRHLVRQKFYLMTMAAIFLGGATEAGMAQWLPSFAQLELHFSSIVGGGSLLGFSVAMAVGRMVVGTLNNRFSIYKILAWCCATTTVLFIVAGFSPSPEIALAASIVSGFTGSCLWPSILGVAADRYPLGGASMFGLLAVLGNLGCIFMPWLIGIIADQRTIALGLAFAALCPALMLVVLFAMHRDKAVPASSA